MADTKIKVLVVDDEKIIRDFFARLLSLQGLEVIEAEDGYKASELAKGNKFDLYFIDVRMPGMDGLETFRQIRQIHPEALVVMMTGYALDNILEQAQKEGASGSIRKPFAIGEIKGIVEKAAREKNKEAANTLVIDDDQAVLNFFGNFLKVKNQKYSLINNAKDALELIQREKFNLVFLDLVLKDADGLELYKKIKEILPQAEIVIITGYHDKAKEIEGKADISGLLYKPFEIEGIIKYIEKIKPK
ncbi:MAG TPA: hypothetical protein DEA99_05000 [Candidatus Omnitrophica bacterium]|nr:hypothetical protein [Candidatus Omnitrophota bacterium]